MFKGMLAVMKTVAGVASLVAVLLLSVVLWYFAPVLFGLQAWWAILLVALVPVLLWLGVWLILVRRAQKRDAALMAGATQEDEGVARAQAATDAAREEQSAVAGRLTEALKAMKAAGGGKGGYLYERPWYVLIGPPGSGKTTAIRNSGLNFPLAEGRVSGVGGTRNCDWWITEQAVLIDTAGRYTTQDSDAQADKAGWERFLDLLRRERPQQPLNGVVVTFGADMLTRLDAAGREQHAQTVRKRVRELEQRLGQRLPVYFLISKADLVVGFTEFFDDLDREGRHQVWGMSFPPEPTPEGPVGAFQAEFQALLKRLQDRLFDRLQAERGAEQRAAIAGFPAQFASLQEPVAAFLKAAFGGSKLDPAPYLRGLYFTSGTQEGTPIDRLTGALSRAFALDARRPAALSPAKGRSYFLGRLLLDVVFNEARLAVRDQGVERRQRRLQVVTLVLSGLLLVGGLAWGWHAVSLEGERKDRMAAAADTAEEAAKQVGSKLPLDRANPRDDVARALPLLQAARGLPPAAIGDAGGLGLGQQDKLTAAGELAYKHALERVLLPRLMSRLEGQMREQMQQPQFLYLATRVYLMLGRQGPMDAALIQEWMDADWTQTYPGTVNAPVRTELAEHLTALLAQDFTTFAMDGTLVDAARRVFSRLPMDERIYARLRSTATEVAPWRPADALGLSGQRLFVQADGQPLADAGVPGLFTVEGLHRSLLPRLPRAIEEAASEAWVLGPEGAALAANAEQMESAVLRRYATDYADEWQKMLDGLDLASLGTPAQAADALNLLGAPNSPLRDLLPAVARRHRGGRSLGCGRRRRRGARCGDPARRSQPRRTGPGADAGREPHHRGGRDRGRPPGRVA
jgi:type VI secretion system protein ImpL